MGPSTNPADASAGFPYERYKAPVGIRAYCLLGTVVASVGIVLSAEYVAAGGERTLVGVGLVGLAVCKLAVLHGLWTLESWGWTGSVVFQLGGLGLAVGRESLGGIGAAAVFIAYFLYVRDYYR